MRILYINHYAGSPRHGMEFRPYYLAREWVKAGHEVNMLAADTSHLRQTNPQLTAKYQDEDIDGIRQFAVDQRKLEDLLAAKL